MERYRDLISIEVVHTLNAALCDHHLKHCPPSEQLNTTCKRVNDAYRETIRLVREMDDDIACSDMNEVRAATEWLACALRCWHSCVLLLRHPGLLFIKHGVAGRVAWREQLQFQQNCSLGATLLWQCYSMMLLSMTVRRRRRTRRRMSGCLDNCAPKGS